MLIDWLCSSLLEMKTLPNYLRQRMLLGDTDETTREASCDVGGKPMLHHHVEGWILLALGCP